MHFPRKPYEIIELWSGVSSVCDIITELSSKPLNSTFIVSFLFLSHIYYIYILSIRFQKRDGFKQIV